MSHPLDPDALEVVPGRERAALEGMVPELASDDDLRRALEQALDYRGDVTITRRDGTQVEGYIFDRHAGASLADSYVRLIPKGVDERVRVSFADIAGLAFSGRDMAAGKSWEAWLQRYWAKRQAGEGALDLHPEPLDE